MLKKLIRKMLVAKAEVEFVKTVIDDGNENTELINETDTAFDAMTDIAYAWVIEELKTAAITFGIAAVICAVIVGVAACI